MGLVKNILYKISTKNLLTKFKNQTIFPYYHLVSDNQVPHVENLYQFKSSIQFIEDITILTENYSPLHPKDLLNNKIPDNHFLLTFDDGLQEIYSVIYPILKERNLKAIFFINPNFVDNQEGLYKLYLSIIITRLKKLNYDKSRLDKIATLFSFSYKTATDFNQKLLKIKYSERSKLNEVLEYLNINSEEYLKEIKPYITKSQIQEMIDDGFYFGGHTMSHPPLNEINHDDQKSEIINSINWLKENFTINYSFFAFPFTDKKISKRLLDELMAHDKSLLIFGNSGLKKDFDSRIIQRFSLENPEKDTKKQIVTENLYKYFNKIIGKYYIARK